MALIVQGLLICLQLLDLPFHTVQRYLPSGQVTGRSLQADGLRRSSTVSGITTYYVYNGQTPMWRMTTG